MKFLALIFILEAFIGGSLPVASGICHDKDEVVASSPDQEHSDSQSESEHDHEGNLNHRCHIGHCTFLVTESAVSLPKIREIFVLWSPSGLVLASLPSNPFRPPIG